MSEPVPLPGDRPAACPICGRAAAAAFRPFCSARCSDIDLGRWLSDRYVIPGDDDAPPPDRAD